MTNSNFKVLTEEMRAGFASINRKLSALRNVLDIRFDAAAKYMRLIESHVIGLNQRVRTLEVRVKTLERNHDDAD